MSTSNETNSKIEPPLSTTLLKSLRVLLEDEPDTIANLANASAFIFEHLSKVNWVGFYLLKEETLVLGPFQGKPACVRIQNGKGVCGTATKADKTYVVPNVHEFPGHIACDAASKSEIVIPLHANGAVVGCLDIDSPEYDRFSQADREWLEEAGKIIEQAIKNDVFWKELN
ncbi:GAF domain-containing protein [Bacillaceae bacterium SIJ1]|uniref:GAF domain-containing protein n=1 Tax=Litoribacterium kuwaitense TaxID=1398745 RepID=UPI0013ED70A2|nr:GAF domain-containing protein [Litoribacterium kuwaitense]NGP44183.1 GAF domain-containing protein [Litoribacterium kuwaitense]